MTEKQLRELDCAIAERVFGWVGTWPVSGLSRGDVPPEDSVPIYRGWKNEEDHKNGVLTEVPLYLNRCVIDADH